MAPTTHKNTLMSIHNRSRQILIHGLTLVMVGLVWGFLVPHTPHPRLALGAHIQFVTNGLLIIVMAMLLLKLPHNVGPKSAAVMLLAAWLTSPMALSGNGDNYLGKDPASTKIKHRPVDRATHAKFSAEIKNVPPDKR